MKSEPATVASEMDNNPPDLEPRRPPASSGSPSPNSSRLPRARGWSSRLKMLVAVGAVLLLSLGSLGAYSLFRGGRGAARPDLVLHKVKYDRLELTVVERGALESARNSD